MLPFTNQKYDFVANWVGWRRNRKLKEHLFDDIPWSKAYPALCIDFYCDIPLSIDFRMSIIQFFGGNCD